MMTNSITEVNNIYQICCKHICHNMLCITIFADWCNGVFILAISYSINFIVSGELKLKYPIPYYNNLCWAAFIKGRQAYINNRPWSTVLTILTWYPWQWDWWVSVCVTPRWRWAVRLSSHFWETRVLSGVSYLPSQPSSFLIYSSLSADCRHSMSVCFSISSPALPPQF